MATTTIEWTDKVWNPVTGCTKVSQGCKHCYAETIARRFWATQYPPNADGTLRKFTDVRIHPERLNEPIKWRKPARVFVNSMSDLFHEDVPDKFIGRVWSRMLETPRHTYQILTKRPQRMYEIVSKLVEEGGRKGLRQPDNIWLGVSAENQQTADERIPLLLKTPAAVRFASAEPLLGEIDLSRWLTCWVCGGTGDMGYGDCPGCNGSGIAVELDWVIVGGESGKNARPMHPDWARGLRDQCQAAGVAFHFKQWGEWLVSSHMRPGIHRDPGVYYWPWKSEGDTTMMVKVGKKNAGRLLDGREWNEFPEDRR